MNDELRNSITEELQRMQVEEYGITPQATTLENIMRLVEDWHNKQIEEAIKKPHILPKNAQHMESLKQGINFYHRQMRKRVSNKLKEVK